jgi:hypothetical protein
MSQGNQLESNIMVKRGMRAQIDLRKAFLGLQTEMAVKLGSARTTIGHPVAKGDVTENSWRGMLEKYLPKRYAVEKAFVVDSDGGVSDQIDLVIFDRHFSPFLFHQEGAIYIPAESVYAVFEIKQELTKRELVYSAKKVESVRTLKRTSTHIPHAGGRFRPVLPKDIIGGVLCLASKWKRGLSNELITLLKALPPKQRLTLVCILEQGSISLTSTKQRTKVKVFPAEQALIQFFLSLLHKLQGMGSVPAIDIKAYGQSLSD